MPIDVSAGQNLEDLERRRKLAQSLQQQATQPVQNNFQALTSILSNALGKYSENKIDKERTQAMAGLLSNSGLDKSQQAVMQSLPGDMQYKAMAEILSNQMKPKEPLSNVAKIQADINAGIIDQETGKKALEKATALIDPYQAAQLGLANQRLALQAGQNNISNMMRQDQLDWQRQQTEFNREEKQRVKAERGAENYAKQIESSGLAELNQQLNLVNSMLPTEGEDIPGFGRGMGLVPDALVSQEGEDLRQAVAGLRNNILKARSGGAVTPAEADRLLQELGEGLFKSDSQLRKGLSNVESILQAKMRNIAAGVPREALDIYKERGGQTLPQSLSPAAAPDTSAPAGVDENTWKFMTPEERALWNQ